MSDEHLRIDSIVLGKPTSSLVQLGSTRGGVSRGQNSGSQGVVAGRVLLGVGSDLCCAQIG